jgi:Spy/CpxP family protein refolding chaperone
MMKKVLFSGTFVACLLFVLATAWAIDESAVSSSDASSFGPGHSLHGEKMRGGGPLAQLDLTDEQQTTIRGIHQTERERLKTMSEEARQSREAVHAAMQADPVDPVEVRRLAHEQADKRVDLKLAQQQTRQQVDAQLTPEQRQKLEQLREERHERRQERMASGSGRGPGMKGGYGR